MAQHLEHHPGEIDLPTAPDAEAARPRLGGILPGLLVALAVAALATVVGHWVPLVGGPVSALLIGVIASTAVPALRRSTFERGHLVASRTVLQVSIVVLGTGLSMRQVIDVGWASLPVMLASLAASLGGAALIGRWLGIDHETRTLIGVGTGICGASAIAAAGAVLKPKQEHLAYALGTIFVFNITAVLAFPVIGHLLHLDGEAFGLWSGTAVNDMSSVVAVAYGYGDGAGPHAVMVKLTRSLMIIPICLALAAMVHRRARRAAGAADPTTSSPSIPWSRVVPPFLIGFVLTATLNSVGLIPLAWQPHLATLGTFLITVALAGIGLSMRIDKLREAGHRPLLLGGVVWILVAAVSLSVQWATGLM